MKYSGYRWSLARHEPRHRIWRWRDAYQNDFSAARMDWTIKPYDEANHPPSPKLGHSDRLTARPGDEIQLSAEGSSDPDGDAMSYHWFYYGEAGTLLTSSGTSGQPVPITNFDQVKASLIVPMRRLMPPGWHGFACCGRKHALLAAYG